MYFLLFFQQKSYIAIYFKPKFKIKNKSIKNFSKMLQKVSKQFFSSAFKDSVLSKLGFRNRYLLRNLRFPLKFLDFF